MADIYPLLVGDIGGTNARFAIAKGDHHRPEQVMVLPVAQYATIKAAIEHYLQVTGARPIRAVIAIAGPAPRDPAHEVRFTNNPWRFTMEGLAEDLGLVSVMVLNDFEALASALPFLQADEAPQLNDAPSPQDAMGFYYHPMAVVGPGTGMGVAALAPMGGRSLWASIPGEGGHVDLPVVTAEEIAVYQYLLRQYPRVSAETALAGEGMARLYAALADVRGMTTQPLAPPAVTQAGLEGPGLARDCLMMYLALMGGFAGNVALTFGAKSGLFLGGGILPRLRGLIAQSDLRARFEAKSPHENYMRAIPLRLIVTEESPALLGAAAWYWSETLE